MLTPPMQVPDAFVQFDRAVGVAQGELLGQIHDGFAGGWLPSGVTEFDSHFEALAFNSQARISRDAIAHAALVPWGSDLRFVHFPATTEYPPLLYLPGALAVAVTRLVRGNVFDAYYALSAVNGLAFLSLMGLSVFLLGSVSRWVIFGVGVLPMSLSLGVSPSTDGYLIGLSCLVAAIVSRHVVQRLNASDTSEGMASADWPLWPVSRAELCAAAAVFLVGSAKPPYLVLAALLALPDINRHRYLDGAIRTLSRTGLIGLLIGGWYLFGARFQGLLSMQAPRVSDGEQLLFVLRHPETFFGVVGNSVIVEGAFYAHGLVGILGWLNAPLSPGVTAFLLIGLTVLVYLTCLVGQLSWRVVAWSGATAMAGFLAIIFALYIDFTPVAYPIVLGVQGRYFLPLLPVAVLAAAPQRRLERPRVVFVFAAATISVALALVGWYGTASDLLYRYWVR